MPEIGKLRRPVSVLDIFGMGSRVDEVSHRAEQTEQQDEDGDSSHQIRRYEQTP